MTSPIRVGHIDLSFRDASALADPKALLGGVDQATLLIRKDAEERIGGPALRALAGLSLGNARVSALDDRLRSGTISMRGKEF